jgi:hypothetical protein
MTTERNEIIIEGSNNGKDWLGYEFSYKPGNVNRPPPFVGNFNRKIFLITLAPHQPRLDWQVFTITIRSAP